jgi:hypothetical protein
LRWRHRVCFAIRGPSGVCKAASMNGQHEWFHATFEYFSPRLPAYLQWMRNNGLKDPEPQPGEQCDILRRRVQESLPAAQRSVSSQFPACQLFEMSALNEAKRLIDSMTIGSSKEMLRGLRWL